MDLISAYEVLGLSIGASPETSKLAYRRLIAYWHPDRNPSTEAQEKSQELNRAFRLLQKAGFPSEVEAASRMASEKPPANAASSKAQEGGDWYYGYYRRQYEESRTGAPPKHGRPIHRKVRLSIEEAAFGATVAIRGKVRDNCKACNGNASLGERWCSECSGQGYMYGADSRARYEDGQLTYQCAGCKGLQKVKIPCSACNGVGTEATSREYAVKVRIPPGVENGTELILRGLGGRTSAAEMHGDFIIKVELKCHEFFYFDSDGYLAFDLPVTMLQLLAEESVLVPTLWGGMSFDLSTTAKTVELPESGFPGRKGERFPLRVNLKLIDDGLSKVQAQRVGELLNSFRAEGTRESEQMRQWREGIGQWKARTGGT